tara:strand:- start:1527 stop:1769 length:243 start_codon:yes stop_codon:yes gene_type:complete
MDTFDRVNLVTSILDGAYMAALAEHHDMQPADIDDDKFSDLSDSAQSFLLSFQQQMLKSLDLTVDDFAIELPSDKFIFDA